MGAVLTRIECNDGIPTIEEIASQFRDATGLELGVVEFGAGSYALSSPLLGRDVELALGPVLKLVRFRAHFGYFEWGILRALQRLGARLPSLKFPRYSAIRWSSLSWYSRLLHR